MKKLSLLIIILTIFGCSEKTEVINVELHDNSGYGVFGKFTSLLRPNNFEFSYKGVPESITEYVVRSFSLQPEQDLWESFRKGYISEGQFVNQANWFGIDTTTLATIEYNHRILILVGTNENGKRVIIPDTNNDRDFSNDEMFEFEYPLDIEKQNKIEGTLPVVDAYFQIFVNGNIIDHRVSLFLTPYLGRFNVTYNTDDPIEQNYHLLASKYSHKQGQININNRTYNVYVANDFRNAVFNAKNTRIFITPDTILPSARKGDIPYSIGEVVSIDGYDYKIEKVAPLGEYIKIRNLGKNENPIGITEGYLVPRFNAITLERDEFRIDDYQDRYILFDFWGTWCNPCIQLIPELKKLNSEFMHTNFQLVGVAFDRDIDMVRDFVKKNEMDWVHLFVDQNLRDSGSMVDIFKVTSFPTKILVDPSGKILARGRSIDEIRVILNEKINAL